MRMLSLVLLTILFGFSIILAGCVSDKSANKSVAFSSLDDYYASIDYSCTSDADCAIKDVHNCCGIYPQCVNKDVAVSPEFVDQKCQEENMSSICGFPSISSCSCINQRCGGSNIYKAR
ncbi:hypothetical protein HYW21_02760 [Candidatus Woesearchaeota archaeon]|nr:hypothetical protein [Candidatus Woesearchaeota archaeon]